MKFTIYNLAIFSTDIFLSIILYKIYLNLLTKLLWRALQEPAV